MLSTRQKYHARLYRSLLFCFLLSFVGNLLLPGRALAWKPTTHVFLGNVALADALDNGKVTIYRVNYRTGQIIGVVGEYDVDPTILAALQSNSAQYHAGILGPDAYPDILTGQQQIHPSFEHTQTPGGTNSWLTYLWYQSTLPANSTPAIKAFTIGYLTHAAGDMFGHTFINNFTGGEFAITPPEGPANAIKHVLLEGYVDKRLDKSKLDASFFNASIAGVDQFIYRTLVDARPGTYLGNVLLRDGAPDTDYSIPRIFSTLRARLVNDIAAYRASADDCEWYDPTCSATILNLIADYEVAWVDDIDEGLRLWPSISHQVAIALFFNIDRKANVDSALTILQNYATNHLLSMAGAPDFVGLGISLLGDVIDAITPDFLAEPIRELKSELLNTLLKEAIGMDKEDLKKYLTNPELYFDLVLNSGAGENVTLAKMNGTYLHLNDPGYSDPNEAFDYQKVPATYNTATMSKLILLNQSEINRLLSDLGSASRTSQPNVMLGFVPSLDGSLQWLNGMIFAQDSNVYCQVFMLQPGETPINCPPLALPDSGYTTADNVPLVVQTPGVLANDSDPDGDVLTSILTPKTVYQPQHGSVTMGTDGSFTYTPNGAALNDAFGYYISDGIITSNIVWVTISITPGNDPPTANDDGSFLASQDVPFTLDAPGVLSNDHDPDSDPLTAIIVSDPSNGTIALDSTGSFVYTPILGFYGEDSFTYKTNDGNADSATASVLLTVLRNFNQVTANDESYVTLKNRSIIVPAPGLLANDTNRDGLPLQAHFVGGRTRGEVTLALDGSFIFTPEVDFVGDTGFVYEATDGVVSSNQSATQIIIRDTNATPVAEDDSYVTVDKATLIVDAPGLLDNDWDSDYHEEYEGFGLPPNDAKRAILVSATISGELTLNSDGSFIYMAGAGFSGRDSFTYKTSDGWDESNIATVRISDSTVNQEPVASDDGYQTNKDTQLEQPAPGLLANDMDGDGDPLTLLIEQEPISGTVKVNADGSFVYSPTLGFEGVDRFTYSVADSLGVTRTATVILTVGNPATPNQQPVAVNDHATTQAGTAVTLAVKANDSDPDGDPLTVTISGQPSHGTATVNNGQIVYTPSVGFVGTDSLIYSVADGKGGSQSATVTVTVTAVAIVNRSVYLPLVNR